MLQLYINDEFFDTPTPENAFLSLYQPKLDILYEDEHILLVDKRPGLVVHPDETERVNTLITHIQAYLYQKKEWSPYWENAFAPALCNRIDRNTGGIVIAAKTAEALRVMNQKIRDRELNKYYLCVVHGQSAAPRQGKLEGYLLKDEAKKQVYRPAAVPCPGAKTAVTLYKTLAVRNGLSLVECRAHHRAHPPDPGPVRRRRPPPAGGRQVWQRAGEQALRPQLPGPVLLPAGVLLHHRRRGAGSSGRTAVPGGAGGLRDGIFSRLFPVIPAGPPGSPSLRRTPSFPCSGRAFPVFRRGDFTEIFDKIH